MEIRLGASALARGPGAGDNGAVARLSDDQVRDALDELPGWARDGDMLVKTYELASFPAAVDFLVRIAERAEAANHHPDLDLRYRRLRVALTTHDEGGLSDLDLRLATEIEALAGRST